MKYTSVDKLSDFEFHDAEFALEAFDENRLTLKASYLNIHKDAEENDRDTDMEIANAFLTFEGFHLLSYEPGVAWQEDENGKLCPTGPQIIFKDDCAYSRFSEQLEAGLTVFDFGIKEGNTYFMDAMSADPFFTVCFTFKSVRVEWDEYHKEAWYASW